MKTTVFNCDKCGQAFEASDIDRPKPFKSNVLLEVSIKIGANIKSSYQRPTTVNARTTTVNAQICRKCLKNLGLDFSFDTEKEYEEPTYLSLQDKFINILSELGVKFEE